MNSSNRWRFESNDYYYGSWAQVDDNTYALAFYDYNDGGYMHVYDISDDAATVTLKKDFRFSESTSRWDGYYPSMLKLGSDIYIIAYQDHNSRGVIKTFTISNDGGTVTQKDYEFLLSSSNNSYMGFNRLVQVDNNTVALAYSGAASGAEGWIATFNVDPSTGEITGASGSSNKYVNKIKHDVGYGKHNSFVKLGGDKYVLAHEGVGMMAISPALRYPMMALRSRRSNRLNMMIMKENIMI